MLPGDVLLEIFDFYQAYVIERFQGWRLLVHVCQRWRQIVFASPRRLDLRIPCTRSTPVRKLLYIWPALPIFLSYYSRSIRSNADDAIAALEHPDRVCDITLNVTGSVLKKMEKALQVPFPVLTDLFIKVSPGVGHTLPREFLGASAPSLRAISMYSIPYPSLPRLLLSASDLTHLSLYDIPPTGYISPEAMVVGLAALQRLKFFSMDFRSASSRPDRIHPPPTIRTVLPSLYYFKFKGASEYLEGLVAQIDSPQLEVIYINYFNQLADFQASQLFQFIDCSVGPRATLFRDVTVTFACRKVSFDMYPYPMHAGLELVRITIICEGIDWQVSHMSHLLNQSSVTLSNVVHLKLTNVKLEGQLEGMDDVEWRDLLHPFSSAKSLHVSKKFVEHVSLVLENIAGGIVLPSLDSIHLVGEPASSSKKLLSRRRVAALLPAPS